MNAPINELNWWIEANGSTHTSPSNALVPTGPVIAAGKIYPESRSGVISRIGNQPARISMVSRQLLDALHARFPGTRWWVRDPTPAQHHDAPTPAVS